MAPLTRNLYRLEEVKAALIHALSSGRTKEAHFWTQELLASECGWELGTTLMETWIWHAAPYDFELPNMIKAADYEGDLDETLSKLLHRLEAAIRSAGRSNLVLHMMVAGTKSWAPGPVAPPWTTTEQRAAERRAAKTGIPDDMCHTISYAARSGCVGRAWYFLSRLPLDKAAALLPLLGFRGSSILQETVRVLCYLSSVSDVPKLSQPALAAATCLVASRAKQRTSFAKKGFYEAQDVRTALMAVDRWIKCHGKRIGRIYEIPRDCLYGMTQRGRLGSDYETISELRDILTTMQDGGTTPFWERILQNYSFESDGDREDFFDSWFPNDIPDEWSLADQQKSHGDCVLPPDSLADARTFVGKYFYGFRKSRLVGQFRYLMQDSTEFLDFRAAYAGAKTRSRIATAVAVA